MFQLDDKDLGVVTDRQVKTIYPEAWDTTINNTKFL